MLYPTLGGGKRSPEDRQLVLEKWPRNVFTNCREGKMEDDLEYRLVSDGKHPMFIKQILS